MTKHFQKMTLVPLPREGAENITVPAASLPVADVVPGNILSIMESQMREIMANPLMDDKTKWTFYEELLRRTQTMTKKQNPDRSSNEQWLNLFPLKYRAAAKRIFDHLTSNDSRLRWSDETGLVTIDGQQLLNSHISELIFYTLKINEGNRKKIPPPPAGWLDFQPFVKACLIRGSTKLPFQYPSQIQVAAPIQLPSPAYSTPIKKRLRKAKEKSANKILPPPSKKRFSLGKKKATTFKVSTAEPLWEIYRSPRAPL